VQLLLEARRNLHPQLSAFAPHSTNMTSPALENDVAADRPH
jgi:hypothetical protein